MVAVPAHAAPAVAVEEEASTLWFLTIVDAACGLESIASMRR